MTDAPEREYVDKIEKLAAERAVRVLTYKKALQVVWARFSLDPLPPIEEIISQCPHPRRHRQYGSVYQADEWCADCEKMLDS